MNTRARGRPVGSSKHSRKRSATSDKEVTPAK